MPHRSKFKTRRASARHRMTTTETDMPDPIVSRATVASTVETMRQVHGNTDHAIQRAAERLGLPAETVAQIAAEEAHAQALAEKCAGCGACKCGKTPAGIEAEAVPY
jgi:hypothetical protein